MWPPGPLTTVTYILLPLLEGTVLLTILQAQTEFDTVPLLYLCCSYCVLIKFSLIPRMFPKFEMCSSICSHQWCPSQKEKEKKNLGAPHNKLICHTIKLHRTSLNSRDFFKFVMKTGSLTNGDGLVVQTSFDNTKVLGSSRLVGEWASCRVFYH
jgi:hypothetical protein